jgi:hypothetical protein
MAQQEPRIVSREVAKPAKKTLEQTIRWHFSSADARRMAQIKGRSTELREFGLQPIPIPIPPELDDLRPSARFCG